MSNEEPPVFKIGLVMAGAVSAGAYTAGVVDFLFEALEAWEQEKVKNPGDTPPHKVSIEVITGASAGSITAAVLTSSLRDKDYPNVLPTGQRTPSKLYRAWVDEIDFSKLLDLHDLDSTKAEIDQRSLLTKISSFLGLSKEKAPKPGEIKSVLNADALDDINQAALNTKWTRQQWPSYLANPLQLYFTVTNLRGIPYGINFSGQTGNEFGMSMHADYMSFRFASKPDTFQKDNVFLDHIDGLEGNWKTLAQSALASGAFPVGLAARVLQRSGTSYYDDKFWPVPVEPDKNGCCVKMEKIEPGWSSCVKNENFIYEFVNVDGGVANNEPFELARQFLVDLEDDKTCRLPRSGKAADRTVIMIDPFPDGTMFDCAYTPSTNLTNVLKKLFGAMISQLRFKTEELELAKRPDVHSRWIIAPFSAYDHPPIASAALGSFGGFLHRSFREHDYHLGRKNCQEFLSSVFLLHETNPCLQAQIWNEGLKKELGWATEDSLETVKNRPAIAKTETGRYLPVIPLYGECKKDIDTPVWPDNTMTADDFDKLTEQIQKRLNGLVGRLIESSTGGTFESPLLSIGWKLFNLRNMLPGQKNIIVAGIINNIKNDLAKNKLV
jgi:predicted acylesterase/phospholipase RssA